MDLSESEYTYINDKFANICAKQVYLQGGRPLRLDVIPTYDSQIATVDLKFRKDLINQREKSFQEEQEIKSMFFNCYQRLFYSFAVLKFTGYNQTPQQYEDEEEDDDEEFQEDEKY
ncbi:hypothetical protein pb186bvf_006780 [Paramecium bursaria]